NIQVDAYTKKSGPPTNAWGMQGAQGAQMQNQWTQQRSTIPVWKPQFQKSPPMGMMGAGKGGGKGVVEFEVQHPDKTVWLGNLAPGTTHVELMPVMKQAGNVKRVQVGKKGTGFAFFSTAQETQMAIANLNGAYVNGSNIQVDAYTKKSNF
ncbi:unnamed protein product, partial [Polarella glacialis]